MIENINFLWSSIQFDLKIVSMKNTSKATDPCVIGRYFINEIWINTNVVILKSIYVNDHIISLNKIIEQTTWTIFFLKIAQIPRKKRFGSVFVTLNVKYVLFLIEFSLSKEKKTKDRIKFYQKNNEFKLCKKCRFFPKKPPFIQSWIFEKKLHDICWHQRIQL